MSSNLGEFLTLDDQMSKTGDGPSLLGKPTKLDDRISITEGGPLLDKTASAGVLSSLSNKENKNKEAENDYLIALLLSLDEPYEQNNEENESSLIRVSMLEERDLECLKYYSKNISWLNDNIIMNFMINELPKTDPKVMIVELDVWKTITGFPKDIKTVLYPNYKENWSKVFLPIFVNENHWTLAIVDRRP